MNSTLSVNFMNTKFCLGRNLTLLSARMCIGLWKTYYIAVICVNSVLFYKNMQFFPHICNKKGVNSITIYPQNVSIVVCHLLLTPTDTATDPIPSNSPIDHSRVAQIVSLQAKIRDTPCNQKFFRPPEVGLSRWHGYTYIETDGHGKLVTLWQNRPNGPIQWKIKFGMRNN